MKRYVTAILLATVAVVPGAMYAATVNSVLSYEKNNVGLDGGSAVGFDKFTSADLGIAKLRFGAKASGGEVDAEASIGFSTTFANSVVLDDAGSVSVDLNLNSLSFGYEAFTGAEAGAFVDFDSFSGINLPEFAIVGDGFTLNTSASKNSFGNTGIKRDTEKIAGVGPSVSLGLGIRAEVTLDASQSTSFSVSDLQGNLLATHSSGATQMQSFSLLTDPTKMLDLSLEGDWSLQLQDVFLVNSFDSSTGLSAGYELGLAFGEVFGGCGDYSIDSDNENSFVPPRACVADTGVSGDTSELSLINPSPFSIAWGSKTVNLGSISVFAAPAVVPLPAGMPLLIAALGILRLVKRRKEA